VVSPTNLEILGTVLFGLAVLHTFSAKRFNVLAARYPKGSVARNLLHLVGEVEVIFGIWAGVLVATMALIEGGPAAIQYLQDRNFTEPAFVFAIMTIAATRPILHFASTLIAVAARIAPFARAVSFYFMALVLGPLLGSFITEPAAMTVTALILKHRYYDRGLSTRCMYATLGVLFVNVSIGGTLTPFAAPPVLMVASTWQWDLGHMLGSFGWKAALAVLVNALAVTLIFRRELRGLPKVDEAGEAGAWRAPWWLVGVHLAVLTLVVLTAHHVVVFVGVFLFFLGFVAVTEELQDPLQLREGLLVGFFLAGLVTLGGLQSWWLDPILRSLDVLPLYLGTAALTAITDNAALTYLGSQVPGLTEAAKYALVAGAVAGGGLTVIANAPNPAGYGILRPSFGTGVSPLGLLLGALGPTLVALACFLWLPSL
jgi:hypothetical protein